jgi:hypothetical protein
MNRFEFFNSPVAVVRCRREESMVHAIRLVIGQIQNSQGCLLVESAGFRPFFKRII